MGGVNSMCLPRYQNPNLVRENHTSTPKRKGHRRNLSAAFNMADSADVEKEELVMEQLNINTATEEELMTLPGINRDTAHNIVEYRRQIGSFKKVEDLALVSRVGATKLNLIRMEICVGRKKSSQSSSMSSSRNDVSAVMDSSCKTSTKSQKILFVRVNVNTSNVFQLMKVKDITQIIAQNIVAHRDKKGQFRTLDDLIRVKGINSGVLSAIRPHLMLSGENQPPPGVQSSYQNGDLHHLRTQSFTQGFTLGGAPLAVPLLSGSQDDLLNMYGPISRRSFRCKRSPPPLRRNGQPVIRIATWNLEHLDDDKAANPGVKEVISMTTLEQGWSVVGIQGCASATALHKICDEINHSTLPNVKKFSGRRGCWKVVQSENMANNNEAVSRHLAFMYDASQDMELVTSRLLQPPDSLIDCLDIYMAHFKVRGQDVVLVNLMFSQSLDELAMQELVAKLHEQIQDCTATAACNVFILGDMSHGSPEQVLSSVERLGYGCLECRTAGVQRPSTKIQMLALSKATQLNKVQSGVIEEGLTNPWIPDGWRWGGSVSNCAPLWCEVIPTSPYKFNGELDAGLHSELNSMYAHGNRTVSAHGDR